MSEIAKVFKGLPKMFHKGTSSRRARTTSRSARTKSGRCPLRQDKCEVHPGKPAQDADCFFKASRADVPRRLERQAHARSPRTS